MLAQLLRNEYLHREVREKGGAYGSGASVSTAAFSMTSYRDPYVNQTLTAFENAVRWTLQRESYKDEVLSGASRFIQEGVCERDAES